MDSFYFIVLAVATIVLIMMLAFLGWTMSNAKKATRFPTITTTCPDNWKSEKQYINNKDVILCKIPKSNQYNYANNITSNINMQDYMDFSNEKWNKDSKIPNPTCAKKKWAEDKKISWDSVINANYC